MVIRQSIFWSAHSVLFVDLRLHDVFLYMNSFGFTFVPFFRKCVLFTKNNLKRVICNGMDECLYLTYQKHVTKQHV